jgi:hypothetical protein
MSKFLLISNEIDLTSFDCGNQELNAFLKQKALLNKERMLGSTALLITDENSSISIIGYYTLCFCHVSKEALSKKFGGNLPQEIPAIKLARLAVVEPPWPKGEGFLFRNSQQPGQLHRL